MKGIEAYQDTVVTTQSKGRLIVMLYEGAIKFLKLAVKEIEAGNAEGKGKYIVKAQDIIFELNTALDMEVGSEIAKNLRGLYTFMNQQLNQANVKQDTNIINDVVIGSLPEKIRKPTPRLAGERSGGFGSSEVGVAANGFHRSFFGGGRIGAFGVRHRSRCGPQWCEDGGMVGRVVAFDVVGRALDT